MTISRTSRAAAAALLAVAPSTLGAAGAANALVCVVDDSDGHLGERLARRLCDLVAKETNATPLPASELARLIEGGSMDMELILVLRARAVSPATITYSYEYGSREQWRSSEQISIADLRVDIMDATLNEAALSLLARTVKSLTN